MRTGRPTENKKGRTIQIRVDENTYDALLALGNQFNATVSELVREAINEYLIDD